MNEQQIRDALRGVAEADGAPDEAAAWQSIRAGIDDESKKANRRKVLLGGAGLALLGAAAAFAVVAGTGEDPEAVEIGPAAGSSTTGGGVVDDSSPDLTGQAVPITFPEHPVAVVIDIDGTQRLDLYDGDTGEAVMYALAQTAHSFSEVSVRPDGTIFYTEEFGDSSTVRSIAWDRSAGPTTPYDLDLETNGGTLSPDGSTYAFVSYGVTLPTARIGLVDTSTGEVRYIEYTSEEGPVALGNIRDLEFSPDGTRLAMTKGYEGSGVYIIDVDATSLNDAEFVASGSGPAWIDASNLLFIHDCCYPDFDEPHLVRRYDTAAGGEPTAYEGWQGAEVRSLSSDWDGRLAIVTADGDVFVEGPDGQSIQIDVDHVLAVGM